MKNLCLLLGLLLFGTVNGQEINRPSAITKAFSAPEINAYKQRSQDKVQEFYNYLELLTNPKNTPELNQQIETNIYHLFQNETVPVVDFTSPEKKDIPLKTLLEKLKESPETTFTLSKEKPTRVFGDYWFERFTLTVSSAKKTHRFQLRQKINFTKKTKAFGSEKKKVWELQLGEVR